MFYQPGGATARALRLVYELLELPSAAVEPADGARRRVTLEPDGVEETVKYSIVIATYNRAADLRETLKSLAGLHAGRAVGSDRRRQQLARRHARRSCSKRRRRSRSPLRYLFEREQGRSPALNCGIRAARRRHHRHDRRRRAGAGGLAEPGGRGTRAPAGCDYVGGRVLPIWGGPRPAWLPDHGGKQWAVIALLDYGPEPIEFGTRVPLGVNMAFTRERLRARRAVRSAHRHGAPARCSDRKCASGASARGRPACAASTSPRWRCGTSSRPNRLNKRYFRRWFYWRGISRALLYERSGLDMEAPEQTTLDFSTVPHVLGVPRYLYRKALRSAAADGCETRSRGRRVAGVRARAVALLLRRASSASGFVTRARGRTPVARVAPEHERRARSNTGAPAIAPNGSRRSTRRS